MATNVDRRQLLAGVAMGGTALCAAGVLTACGGSATPAPVEPSRSGPGSAPAQPPAGTLGSVSQAPVGSGFVAADAPVVVTQPVAGEFKAFSAICTHAGCLVSEIASNQIICPCHGSVFSAEDGSVISGPATQALAPVSISVQGTNIVSS